MGARACVDARLSRFGASSKFAGDESGGPSLAARPWGADTGPGTPTWEECVNDYLALKLTDCAEQSERLPALKLSDDTMNTYARVGETR